MREPQMNPMPAPHRHGIFGRLLCSVALMTLAGGPFFAGPGFAMDRVARQARMGTFRSLGGGIRLGVFALENRFSADEIDSRPAPDTRLGARVGTDARAKQRRPSRVTAHVPPARFRHLAPQPGALAPPFSSLFVGTGPIAALGSRGPPTL